MSESRSLLGGDQSASARFQDRIDRAKQQGCRDPLWAALFVAQLAVIVLCGIFLFVKNKDALFEGEFGGEGSYGIGTSTIVLSVTNLVLAILCGALFLRAVEEYTEAVVKFSIFATGAYLIALGVISLVAGAVAAGLVLLLFAAIFAFVMWLEWDRIWLAIMTLRIASGVTRNYPASFFTGLFGLVAMALWSVLWMFSTAMIAYEFTSKDSDGQIKSLSGFFEGPIIFPILSYYWTANVINYIVHATVAGLMAAWFFGALGKNPTWSSFKRASLLSLGSIALAALLVAVVQTMRWMLRQLRKKTEHQIALCMIDCCLSCLESLLQYFNKYAIIYMAVYGDDFCTAGRKASDLFSTSPGAMAIMNDALVGPVFFVGSLLVGSVTALLSALIAHFTSSNVPGWMAFGFVAGFLLSLCVLSVLDSAVCTLVVCLAEDPAAFQRLHRAEYEEWAQLVNRHSARFGPAAREEQEYGMPYQA